MSGLFRLWNTAKTARNIIEGENPITAVGKGIKREMNPDKIETIIKEDPNLVKTVGAITSGEEAKTIPIEDLPYKNNLPNEEQPQNDTPTVKELWEREDAIRKETQEREDTAYQRAIKDMLKAGINPNLMGSITPAQSGGGISQATGSQTITTEMNNIIEKALAEISNEIKVNENQKDRISDILRTVITVGMMMFLKS